MENPLVSIVILNYNGEKDLPCCLNSIFRSSYSKFEIIVADNASSDKSVDIIKQRYPIVKLIRYSKNLGFAEGNNQAIKRANGEYIFLLNPDTEIEGTCISRLLEAMLSSPQIGICMPKIMFFYERRVICSAGIKVNKILYGWDRGVYEIDDGQYDKKTWIIGACGGAMMIRKSVFERVGEFDSKYFMYYEDLDLGIRTWLAGYKVKFAPKAIVYHKYKILRSSIYNEYFDHRNRIRTILKDMSIDTLTWILPRTISLNLVTIVHYIMLGRYEHAFYQIKAVLWNIVFLIDTLRLRIRTQKTRSTSDRKFLSLTASGFGYPKLKVPMPDYPVKYLDTICADKIKECIIMGETDDSQLGLGWHSLEKLDNKYVRWTSNYAIAFLKHSPKVSQLFELDLYSPRENRVIIYTNDTLIGEIKCQPQKWMHFCSPVAPTPGKLLKLLIRTTKTFYHKRSNRFLGIAVSSIRLK